MDMAKCGRRGKLDYLGKCLESTRGVARGGRRGRDTPLQKCVVGK